MERAHAGSIAAVLLVLAVALGAAALAPRPVRPAASAPASPLAEPPPYAAPTAAPSAPASPPPPAAPSARSNPALAWDPVHQVILLYGGDAGTGALSDTWTWDGSAWSKRLGESPPGPAAAGQLAFDSARGQALLHTASGTWTWDGAAWSRQNPAHRPPDIGPMAYNPSLGVVVLLPGRSATGGTWTWNGADWSLIPEATDRPPAVTGLVYDARSARLLALERATWAFVGLRWTRVGDLPAGMPALGAATAYAGSVNTPLVFGGDGQQGPADQLWGWDGNGWQPRPAEPRPPGRHGAGMAFDAKRGTLLMFGGQGPGGLLADTWTWQPDHGWANATGH